MQDSCSRPRAPFLRLCAVAALLFAGLLFYSQTAAFAWDEGFHLLAAQLIKAGKKPYLDFCFPQTPLNAYINAAWMKLFGESWRAVHALSALWVAGAAFLTADFVLTHLPIPRWRLAASIAAAVAVAMNSQVVLFGTIGQAYGICLFLTVAAFRLAVVAVERNAPLWAASAGLAAGAAAASSLLTACVAPVLMLWILLRGVPYGSAGSRWLKPVAFVVGAAVPFVPMLWLYAQSSQHVLFNVFRYQVLYRGATWPGAASQDISTLTAWINSAQGLSLGLLAAAGLWFLARKSDWDRARRAEFHLAGWLALALTAELAAAHPTFERYYLLLIPFVAVLAVVGLCETGSRLGCPDRPLGPALLLIVLTALGLGRAIFEDRDSYSWKDCEKIARQADQVTPRGAALWTDELFYFLTRRAPPDGMEFSYAHDVNLPADQAALFHILPIAELHRRVRMGTYATVAACYEPDQVDKLNLAQLYRQQAEIRDCTVYWDWAGSQ